jgi:hypothetical protein
MNKMKCKKHKVIIERGMKCPVDPRCKDFTIIEEE